MAIIKANSHFFSKKIIILAASLLALSGCGEAKKSPSQNTLKVEQQQMVGVQFYYRLELLGKDSKCLEFSANNPSNYTGQKNSTKVTIDETSDPSLCDQEIKVPGWRRFLGTKQTVYPYLMGVAEDWASPEILYGSCSLRIGIGDEIQFDYDICENQLLTHELEIDGTLRKSVERMEDFSENPVSLNEKDQKLQDLGVTLTRQFQADVDAFETSKMRPDGYVATHEDLKKVWEQTLKNMNENQ